MNIFPINNSFNNISFTKKRIPVYAIDSKGNYIKFNSATEAAKAIGVTPPEVSRSLIKRFHRAGGYFIVNAQQIEKKDENGEVAVYQKDIDELIKHRTLEKELYALDQQGNYLKFNSAAEASKELGVDGRAISSVISGKKRTANGYYFTYASKIESKDEEGRVFVDRDKITKIIQKEPLHPIYAIDKCGNYIKFPNQKTASQKLKVSRQRISQVLDSNNSTCNGYYVVPANKIETKDEDGKTIIDKAKIEEMLVKKAIIKRNRSAGMTKKIYAIDSNGRCKKFNSRQEASAVLDIPVPTIGSIIIGEQKTSHGLTFVNASIIERVNKNNEFVIDSEKLQEILEQRFPKTILLS